MFHADVVRSLWIVVCGMGLMAAQDPPPLEAPVSDPDPPRASAMPAPRPAAASAAAPSPRPASPAPYVGPTLAIPGVTVPPARSSSMPIPQSARSTLPATPQPGVPLPSVAAPSMPALPFGPPSNQPAHKSAQIRQCSRRSPSRSSRSTTSPLRQEIRRRPGLRAKLRLGRRARPQPKNPPESPPIPAPPRGDRRVFWVGCSASPRLQARRGVPIPRGAPGTTPSRIPTRTPSARSKNRFATLGDKVQSVEVARDRPQRPDRRQGDPVLAEAQRPAGSNRFPHWRATGPGSTWTTNAYSPAAFKPWLRKPASRSR